MFTLQTMDWDADGSHSVGEIGHKTFQCAGIIFAPGVLESSINFMGSAGLYDCGGDLERRGVELDWTRMWWDLYHDPGSDWSVSRIFEAYDHADAYDWNSGATGPAGDHVLERFEAAAVQLDTDHAGNDFEGSFGAAVTIHGNDKK